MNWEFAYRVAVIATAICLAVPLVIDTAHFVHQHVEIH